MAAYDGDLRQCVTVAQRAEAEYQRKSREQREANAITGLLDRVYSPYRGEDKPCVLYMIPDGKTKSMSGMSGKLAHH